MKTNQEIAGLNDAFRKTFRGGTVVVTRGVGALPPIEQAAVMRLVREFDVFDTGNDPHGEHDFGSIEYCDVRYFWKIDYYDLQLSGGSPNAADPTVTRRVMTIMRADEY